uniref:Uncharacterized protein n=1 Tax=uncultured Alphaproteobacteria bacterium TaxID=91750 RepID=A0A1B0Z257_9PROT|nr:hypothetical protein [uncultured Alphaproteobacteria bacterium]
MSYHQFTNDETGEAYGSFEVFREWGEWHWWSCFPGCLPDGDPIGPFDSEQQAIDDANGGPSS